MPKYVIRFVQFHPEFRLAELESLGKLEGIKYKIEATCPKSPFLIATIANDHEAKKLIQRSILIRDVSELWGYSESLASLRLIIENCEFRHRENYDTESFKFIVDAYGKTIDLEEQIKMINSFSFLGFKGAIDLKSPQNTFTYFEDYSHIDIPAERMKASPCQVYFGVLVGVGLRNVVAKYDLKKRAYLGTTSMDAELSLVMANQALARPGSLILDPFVGTGSFLISCSHFGAHTIGSDIDGRQIRGKGKSSIETNVQQYKLENLVLGNIVSDIAHHPWREGFQFDAIVCDVPISLT